MNTKVSFWLIPAQEDRVFFQDIIDTLARDYNAPTFTPHVTIYFGEYTPDESPAELIEMVTQEVRSLRLNVDKLDYSNQFTKTLFVQFYPSEVLSQISEAIRHNSSQPSNYVLNPHLSLIYKQMEAETQHALATSLSIPKTEIAFNQVSAISTPDIIQSSKDVECWQVLATKTLQ